MSDYRIPDGGELSNDHGYPVGYCGHCGLGQAKLYYLDGKGYCLPDFPKMVDLKLAREKLKELAKTHDPRRLSSQVEDPYRLG